MITTFVISILLYIMYCDLFSDSNFYTREYISSDQLISKIRSFRTSKEDNNEYDFGILKNKTVKRYNNYEASFKQVFNEHLYIKLYISIRGDLVEIFYKDKCVFEYVDQYYQYRHISLSSNDIQVLDEFYDYELHRMLKQYLFSS